MGCETGLVPMINYGLWAGQGYAGGVCLAQAGREVDAALVAVPGVDFMDSVTKNHDINYTYIDKVFGKTGNPDFVPTPEYYRALFAADVEMLKNIMAYRPEPGDLFAADYRDLLIKAFYVKADWGYGLGKEMAAVWKQQLQPLDLNVAEPAIDGPRFVLTAVGGFHQANKLALLQDFQTLVTSNMSGQERMLFNAHLKSLDYLDNGPVEMGDYTRRIVAPTFDPVSQKWTATVLIDGKAVFMELDKGTRVFTRRVVQNGLETIEVYTPTAEPGKGDFNLRGYDVVKTDGEGNVLDHYSIAKPPVPVLFESPATRLRRLLIENNGIPAAPTPEDLQVDIPTPVSGEPYVETNVSALSSEDWQAVGYVFAQVAGDLGEISDVRIQFEGVAPVVVALVSGKEVHVALHDDSWGGGDETGSRSLALSYENAEGQLVTMFIGYGSALAGNVEELPLLGRPASSALGVFPSENNGAITVGATIEKYGPTLIDALSIIRAIQSGDPLPIAASGLRLAVDFSSVSDPYYYTLSGASSVGSSILSLMSLEQALQRGDTLAAVTAGAQALGYGASAYLSFAKTNSALTGVETATDISNFLNGTRGTADVPGTPGALAYLNLVNDISHGDATGVAIDVMYFIPALQPVAIALSVFRMISSLFGGDDEYYIPAVPAAWGSGHYTWDGTGVSYTAAGQTGGQEAVANTLSQFLHSLNTLVAQEQQQNPGSTLGLIPNRMPTLGYSTAGFQFTDIDPVSGVQQHPELRYDNYGRPYNAAPGSPESFQSLGEAFIRSALARGAIAPEWEVLTARMQTDAGDPQAGLTEEARAGQDGQLSGQLAAPLSGATQTFRPVALDLDGDGIETVNKSASGVAFDVDDSGYLKETGWITGGDAFLTLDRNYNGSIDSGREMFSNSVADISRRGLAGMAWLDSNYDGKLTAADPVWDELKVWQDDGDGVDEAGEKHTLATLGITELNYAMSTFAQNGQIKQLASPDLEADRDGARINVIPEGILVQNSADGNLSLLVTRIDDKTAVEANRDGITGFEETETIVSSADLLANDTLGGFLGRDLSVVGLANFRHGSGYLDANGFVHFTPEADYAGDAAGFDYIAQAQNGQQGTAGVDVAVQNVNDAPTLDHVDHDTRPVPGYESTMEETGSGRVVGADIDDPANSLTYELLGQPQWGSVTMDASGNFQYTGWSSPNQPSASYVPGDEIRTDSFQVKVIDPHGASVTQTVDVTHYGPYTPPGGSGGSPASSGGGGGKPISVDMDGNGFSFTKVDDSNVFFDINGDGWKHRMAWVAPGDGLLAYDADGNGKIEHADEISFVGYKSGAQTDLEGLSAFDANGDGAFSAADEKWSKFGVWQDTNQNGITDPGEFKSLDELGIASISLSSDGQFSVIDGQTVHGVGTVTRTDGNTLNLADVTLQYSNDVLIHNPDGTSQVVTKLPFSPSGEALNGTDGNDLILGKTGNNIITTGAGNDVVMEDGGNDFIDGGAGNDTIYSGADNDLVIAGAGDDVVFAGLGNDMVLGGDGHDALFGEGGNDVIFGGRGNDLISGDSGNDVLSGDYGDDQVYGGSGNDAVFGGAGNDELAGMDGYDRLDGAAGNDLLDGGAEADEMIGGSGDDIYVVDNVGDTVTENPDEGIDTVRSSISYTLGANLENLTLTGMENLTGTGNELDNALTGNRGDNVLAGGAGDDRLDGGLGADTLIGGMGDDAYVVDNAGDAVVEAAGEGVDTIEAGVSYALSANVENLTLTGTADINATGNALDNRLIGNAGDNVLDGGARADFMAGGRGDDTYRVDQAGDAVTENAGEGIDTVVSDIGYILGDNLENLVLTGSGNLSGTGNELSNAIQGNAGDNLLDGGVEADALSGGTGNDTYVVDDAGDTVIESADAGTDTVLSGVSYALSANVENIVLTGSAGIDATGNDLDNILTGNDAANVLDGGAGADAMAGGAGDDTYVADDLGDAVAEEADAGIDTVLSSVSFVLPEHVEHLTLTGTAAIDGTGNGLDNTLTGNGAANALDGGIGADRMAGGDGDDLYYVDGEGDAVEEAAGNGYDTVRTAISLTAPENVERIELLGGDDLDATGNALDNALIGNGGANRLDGGLGADLMAGGAGDDTYIADDAGDIVTESAGAGDDHILASVTYALSGDVERLTLTGTADIDGTGNVLDNVLIGNLGANRLDGGAGADAMAGGAGDDAYVVDSAADTVFEAALEGLDTIHTSVSYVLPEHVENLILTGDGNIGAGGNGLDNTLVGNAGDNLIAGGAGNDRLDGAAGNDTLEGGVGNDILIGGAGDDAFLINVGDGLDRIDDTSGSDTVRFGAGLSLDNVALRVTEADGVCTAHVRVLNAGGCEQAGQGFDFAVTRDAAGRYVSPIERFAFDGGSVRTFDDLLIKTVVTYGTAKTPTIVTGRDDDIIYAGPNGNLVRAGSGHDVVYAGSRGDTVYGEGGNDTLLGGTGDDTLDGGCGADILAGSNGRDLLRDAGGNNAFLGGFQEDRIEAGAGSDFVAGGKHDDAISASGGANVVAFNRGDGRDTLVAGAAATNTLSLGGGIAAGDLSFSRSGQDLSLGAGGNDRMTFRGWYAGEANRNFVTLQLIDDDPARGPTGLFGHRIETFDFQALASRFDAACAASPKLSSWSLMNGLLDAHLAGSDDAALGGEIAVRYAEEGSLAMSPAAIQDVLKDARFGMQAQAVGGRLDTGVQQYRIG